MFRLTEDEYRDILRCKNFTSSWGGSRYLPTAFTEQGVYMLMTVLKGELATKQSLALIRLFKSMKDYLTENSALLTQRDLLRLSVQVEKNTSDIKEIKENMAGKDDLQKVMENFIDPDLYKHFLILNGQKIEADAAYTQIYSQAKKTIYVIDNYISLKTLELLRAAKSTVKIIVFSDNIGGRDKLTQSMYQDFKADYPGIDISLQTTNSTYHDRYIILDFGLSGEKIYHCGASSKDAGKLITTISRIENKAVYADMITGLLKNPVLRLK